MKVELSPWKFRLRISTFLAAGPLAIFLVAPRKAGGERVFWTATGIVILVSFWGWAVFFRRLNAVWVDEREFRCRMLGTMVVVPFSDVEDIERLDWGKSWGMFTRGYGDRIVFTFTTGRKPFKFPVWIYPQKDRDRLYGLVIAAARNAGWVRPPLRERPDRPKRLLDGR